MNFPSKVVENAVEHLSRLPGIGKRTALHLVLHLLKQDKVAVEGFGEAFINLINTIKYCGSCLVLLIASFVKYVQTLIGIQQPSVLLRILGYY